LLEIESVSSFYGPIQALREVSLRVGEGEAVALLGQNGAGKSTLLHTISGLVRARRGRIRYRERDITHATTHQIVRAGVVHVPEGRRIFAQMTVRENLLVGAFTRRGKLAIEEHLDFVFTMFPDLATKRGQLGGELSGGQQQMLAIGRALMAAPSMLLLDEPSLGLSPIAVEHLTEAITTIRNDIGVSLLLVEQNAGLALELASRVYVLQNGRVALSGSTNEVSPNEIREAYLGNIAAAS